MTSCCGAERKTAYCPSCGARLAPPSPLEGLLAHCRQQARILEREIAGWEEIGSKPFDDLKPAQQRMLTRHRERLAKWAAWADGLAALLAGAEEGS
jgi:NADH pyrophosphatase NudC (nudix superfamily)